MRWLAWATGMIEALLVVRLLARLLAARPDNPAIQLLYRISTPLIQPLDFLDATQPDYGAVLELSTLVLVMAIPLLSYAIWLAINPGSVLRATPRPQPASKQ